MDNLPALLFSELKKVFIEFRENVSSECGWSLPTFYRRIKVPGRLSNIETKFFLEEADRLINRSLIKDEMQGLESPPMMVDSFGMPSDNHLDALYRSMVNLSLVFRGMVCKNCFWSISKFQKILKQDNPKLSNAEKKGITEICNIVLEQMRVQIAAAREHLCQSR
jgi:hypothetical protein